jgi:putative dimethyl sulfoxide reductase chaperone
MIGENANPPRMGGRNMAWVAQFEGQMLVCGLLAKALYDSPDHVWLNALVQNSVFDSTPVANTLPEIASALGYLQNWARSGGHGLDEAAMSLIREDYTRLFVGPGRLSAAPWESVYTNKDRAVFQMETVSVKNWYRRFDLALASEYNEPADHIGLEFGFLAHLAHLTIAASEIRDGADVKRLIVAQRDFLAQHILKWVPRWADDVVEYARTDFYRGLALLASGTAKEAGSFFSIISQHSPQSGPFEIAEPHSK